MAATPPRSPRTKKTPEEKKAYDEQFKIDPKGFAKLVKERIAIFNALMLLGIKLGEAGKNAHLAWPVAGQPNTFIPYNRKHHRSAQAKFAAELKLFKKYFQMSKKKDRAPSVPSKYSGTYTPVYAGPALQAFFTNGAAGFGDVVPAEYLAWIQRSGMSAPEDPIQQGVWEDLQGGVARVIDYTQDAAGVVTPYISVRAQGSLMANLAQVRQGYLLRNTSTMLFYNYAHNQQLQDETNAQFAKSDAVMDDAFGGTIPAEYFSWKVETGRMKKKEVKTLDENFEEKISYIEKPERKGYKKSMADAVRDRNVTAPVNTYAVIQWSRPDFDSTHFNTYFYQNIAAANYHSRSTLTAKLAAATAELRAAQVGGDPDTIAVAEAQQQEYAGHIEHLNNDANLQEMLNEHNLVKFVSARWHEYLTDRRKPQRDLNKKASDRKKKEDKAAIAAAKAARAAALAAAQ